MKETKINKEEVKRDRYYVDCQECGKRIYGSAASQVLYNLKLHLQTHESADKTKVEEYGEDNTNSPAPNDNPITAQEIVNRIMDDVQKGMEEKGR